jgi:hypothetical protein
MRQVRVIRHTAISGFEAEVQGIALSLEKIVLVRLLCWTWMETSVM